jgi:hypothetical protein
MTEWGLTPEYILESWTEAKLLLMFVKRRERIMAINESMKPKERTAKQVAEEEFMAQTGGAVYIHRAKGNA